MTNGFWNCGLLFWRPHAVHPVTFWFVSPPANRGSVGSPGMPYRSSIVGPPVPGADLPASPGEIPNRTSSSELLLSVCVMPPAACRFRTYTNALLGLPVSPGIGDGSKLSTLRWLYRTNAVVASLNW